MTGQEFSPPDSVMDCLLAKGLTICDEYEYALNSGCGGLALDATQRETRASAVSDLRTHP